VVVGRPTRRVVGRGVVVRGRVVVGVGDAPPPEARVVGGAAAAVVGAAAAVVGAAVGAGASGDRPTGWGAAAGPAGRLDRSAAVPRRAAAGSGAARQHGEDGGRGAQPRPSRLTPRHGPKGTDVDPAGSRQRDVCPIARRAPSHLGAIRLNWRSERGNRRRSEPVSRPDPVAGDPTSLADRAGWRR
jgi:hypothetical protein